MQKTNRPGQNIESNFAEQNLVSVKNEKGQSLVEFVLLLALIMTISLAFLKGINSNVADMWLSMGQILVEDDAQQLQLL